MKQSMETSHKFDFPKERGVFMVPEISCVSLEELCAHYKARYEKGRTLAVNQLSKHYSLLQEIELRYRVLSFVIHWISMLEPDFISGKAAQTSICSFLVEQLTKILLTREIKEALQKKNILSAQEQELYQQAVHTQKLFFSQFREKSSDNQFLFFDFLQMVEQMVRVLFIIREKTLAAVCKKEVA